MPKRQLYNNSNTVTADETIFSNYAIWSLTHVRRNESIWGVGCEENPYQDYLLYAFKYTHGKRDHCSQNGSYKLNKSEFDRKWTTHRIKNFFGGEDEREKIFTPQSCKTPINTICD